MSTRLRDLIGVGAVVFLSALAGLVLTEPIAKRVTFPFTTTPGRFPYDSDVVAVAVGVLVAIAAVFARRRAWGLAAAATGAIALLAAALTSSSTTPMLYASAVGAGLLLGGVAIAAERTSAMATGLVVGVFVADPLESARRNLPSQQRSAAYTPLTSGPTPVDRVLVLAAVIGIVAVIALFAVSRSVPDTPIGPPAGRVVGIAVVIPIAAAFAYWWLLHHFSVTLRDSTGITVFWGGYLMLALLLVAALLAPGRSGLPWIAAVAIIAARTTGGGGVDGALLAVVVAGLVGVGALVSWRTDRVSPLVGSIVGLVLLAATTATGFGDGDTDQLVLAVSAAFVVPLGAGLTMRASVGGAERSDHRPVITVTALSAIPLMYGVVGVSAGWNAYVPSAGRSGFGGLTSFGSSSASVVVAALVGISVCVVAAGVLARRRA